MPRPSAYYVVLCDYPEQRRREAIVDPEMTRTDVVARIKSHEYQDILFIHHVEDGLVEDVTAELIDAAELELKEEHRERDPFYNSRVRNLAGVA